MSHNKVCETELACSLEVLKTLIKTIKPEWEAYIETDPSGRLEVRNTYGSGATFQGYSLRIKHGQDTGINYGDIGFKKVGKKWELNCDPGGLPYPLNGSGFLNMLTNELEKLKVLAFGRRKNLRIKAIKQARPGEPCIIDFELPQEA